MQDKNSAAIIQFAPKYLWLFILSYSMVLVISNWFDARLIKIAGLEIPPGTMIFPLTFMISDIITEVYGYKHARRAILTAFLFNVIFLAYGQLVINMPSPEFAIDNDNFNKLLSMNFHIILASFISYLTSEPLNSYIMAKLKVIMEGHYMGIRFVTSTIIAAGIDSMIFMTIAFSGSFSKANVLSMILEIWMLKVFIEILGLPISIRLSKLVKRSEQLDIYDFDTKFKIMAIETHYSEKNNLYDVKREHYEKEKP